MGNYDVMLLAETKILNAVYCKNRLIYDVVCSRATPTASRGAQGGVGLVTREIPGGWYIESTLFHGPNVVSCKIVSGIQQIPLIVAYLTPTTLYHLPGLKEALDSFPRRYPIIMGGLNADVGRMGKPQSQNLAYFLEYSGLVYLLGHFRQWLRLQLK